MHQGGHMLLPRRFLRSGKTVEISAAHQNPAIGPGFAFLYFSSMRLLWAVSSAAWRQSVFSCLLWVHSFSVQLAQFRYPFVRSEKRSEDGVEPDPGHENDKRGVVVLHLDLRAPGLDVVLQELLLTAGTLQRGREEPGQAYAVVSFSVFRLVLRYTQNRFFANENRPPCEGRSVSLL